MSITEETRRESYELVDAKTVRRKVLSILKKSSAPITAHEIAKELHGQHLVPYPVRQAVAPRLTELVDSGSVEVVGKVFDAETQRNVALYRLTSEVTG